MSLFTSKVVPSRLRIETKKGGSISVRDHKDR